MGPRLDGVAVGAANYAFHNLPLRLCDALGVADVQRLSAQVVEMEGRRMILKSAVAAPNREFGGIKPPTNCCGAGVRGQVDCISIPRTGKASQSPRSGLLGIVLPLAWAAVCLRYFFWVPVFPSFGSGACSSHAFLFCVHVWIVHPCKPDIFAKTYEPVDDAAKFGGAT